LPPEPVLIEAPRGETGGQVLRTALSLSLVTGKPFRLVRFRGAAKPPGIAGGHLASIRAAGRISNAQVAGAEVGSENLTFVPGPVRATNLTETVGTAGPATLVLQTVAIPLCLADGPSRLRIRGGTHVGYSPTYEFLESDWAPAMEGIGMPLSVRLVRPGFRPTGGGEIMALVPGHGRPRGLNRRVRSNLRTIQGIVFYSRLPASVAERSAREARRALRRSGVAVKVDLAERPASSPGLGIHLVAVSSREERIGFSVLDDTGHGADRIARRAVNMLFSWLDTGAAVSPYLADQILLPLALAEEPSRFTTSRVGRHLLTGAEVIRRFLPVKIEIEGEDGEPGTIRIERT
jgi:RNA 3'-terminal phosphate cyclase (ATP)